MVKRSGRRTPGDGGLYQRADGMWCVSIEQRAGINGKRQRWTAKSKDKNKVLEKLRKAQAELNANGVIGSKALTVGQWLDKWLVEIVRPKQKPKTFVDYEGKVRLHIKPRVGHLRLHSLTIDDVRRMEQAIATAHTAATARSSHRVLSAALSDAAREGLVGRNVAQFVAPPKSVPVKRVALTAADAKKVLAEVNGNRLESRWLFALYTGCRQGEALGLEWDRVDLKANVVDISWQLQRLPYDHGCIKVSKDEWECKRKRGGWCPKRHLVVPDGFESRELDNGLVLTRPKTSKGQRIIPLPPALADAFRAQKIGRIARGLVWTDVEGGAIDPKHDALEWDRIVTAAEVPNVPLHSARHTTATLLLEAGVDPLVIKEIMGHTLVTTTEAYLHADQTLTRAAMDRLGAALA